ncbi:MAG: S41 family peptidase [Lachnospiraceae bacterium]
MNTENYEPPMNLPENSKDLESGTKQGTEYRKGMLRGIIGTLALLGIVILAAGITLWIRIGQEKADKGEGKSGSGQISEQTRQSISKKEVQGKAGELADLIDQYYYEDIDEEKVVEGMYAGLVSGLGDKYSAYFSAEEYKSLNASTTGSYYGIGAVLSQNPDTKAVTILHVYPGSPAEEAGVKDGDIIVKVEDIPGDSMELSELVKHIKGEEETSVHLQLLREGESDYQEFDVFRRQIEVPTVEHQMLEGSTGLIQISEFTDNTPEQFDAAIKDLQNQGMKSMMIDLRNNPGGVLPATCTMLDELLPKGTVVYTVDKYGKRMDYTSDENCLTIPIAVLINENSASASEIFAGAIKDYEYGTLIGTTSYGKGIVQSIIPLEDGSAVKLTMAKYYTPKGNYIHEVGIEPDITLEYEYQGEDEMYNPMHDNQVLKGLEVLNSQE